MSEKLRCKACGYMVEKDALGDVCPACGVKKEMFEPWEDKVGTLRRTILEFDLHPVVVHAPQALTFLLLILGVLYPLFGGGFQAQYLWPAIVVMTWLLPVALVATILTGFFDAMVRYRKIATPALLTKQLLGYSFTAAALVLVWITTLTGGFANLTVWLSYVAVNAIAMAISAILGLKGVKLVQGVMPGDKIFMKKKKPAAKGAPAKAAPAKAPEAPAEKKE